jgi:adenylate kinase family enzyme
MLERCLKRAETSGRPDDTAEVLEKRVQTFIDSSYPVVEHYEKFGKVSRIDATGDVATVSAMTKAAMLPKTMFLLGQKASGKSTVAKNLVDRATMKHIDFTKWIEEHQLEDEDDEKICLQLIQTLA